MKYYVIIACILTQTGLHAMDNSNNPLHRDFEPGLYQKHQNGVFIKLPHDTWFKEKNDGHVIRPAHEESIVPALNSLVMMLSGFTTGMLVLGIAGLPALYVSGTVLISSLIIQHQNSPWLSPEDKKEYRKANVAACAMFFAGFLSNFSKSDRDK
jgi:hypothetical protein